MTDNSIEKRLGCRYPVSDADKLFIANMRHAAKNGVGYGFMQQITEWEWQDNGDYAWGPEFFAEERKTLTAEGTRKDGALRDIQKLSGDWYQGATEKKAGTAMMEIWARCNEILDTDSGREHQVIEETPEMTEAIGIPMKPTDDSRPAPPDPTLQNVLDQHDCGDVRFKQMEPWLYKCEGCGVGFSWASVDSRQEPDLVAGPVWNADPVVESAPIKIDVPAHWEANYNMRCWVQDALEASGATCTGAGCGGCITDLDIELEGMKYNIQIRAR